MLAGLALATLTEESTRSECAICMSEAVLFSTSCKHELCATCLRKYVESQPSDCCSIACPFCRQPLPPADIPAGCEPHGPPAKQSLNAPLPWYRRRCARETMTAILSGAIVALAVVYDK